MFTIFYGSDKYTISSHGNCLSQPVLPTDQAAAQVAEEVATANGLPIGTIPQLFSWKWFKIAQETCGGFLRHGVPLNHPF